jgi:hypothetical protein
LWGRGAQGVGRGDGAAIRIEGGRDRSGTNHRKGGGVVWDESGGDKESGEVRRGGGSSECGELPGGESGGKPRGEDHRGETSQAQGGLESYIFMDVPHCHELRRQAMRYALFMAAIGKPTVFSH